MPRRTATIEREHPLKAKLKNFWELARTDPVPNKEVQRLGKELLAEYPNDWEVVNACLVQNQPLSRTAYDLFMKTSFAKGSEGVFMIPYRLGECEVEEYFENAYLKMVAFLDDDPDLAALGLTHFAHGISSFSQRAMALLETRIPTLTHDALIYFVMHFGDERHPAFNDIRHCQDVAAKRLLDERPNGVGGSGVELRMLQMPAVRAQTADYLFTHRFDEGQWENVMHFVPEKRTDAWEFAFRSNAVTFKLWYKFVKWFEAQERRESVPPYCLLPDADWDYLWSVGERIPNVKNEGWVQIAGRSPRLCVRAAKKLVELNAVEELVRVVHSGLKQARIVAARHLLDSTQEEYIFVAIISCVPSLRREAARKLLEIPEETGEDYPSIV